MSNDQFDPLRAEWEDRHAQKCVYWTNWNLRAADFLRDR